MRILHIAPEWKWSKIFILPIAIRQIENKHDVWLSTPNSMESDELVKVVSWNKKYKNISKYLLSIFLLIRMVHQLKINKVYAHTTVDSTLYILGLKLFSSVEIVYINHGVAYLGYKGLMRWLLKFCEIININFSHKVITITCSMAPLLATLNYTKKAIEVLNPGTLVGVRMPYDNYQALLSARKHLVHQLFKVKNCLQIIYVGRIEKRKGLYDLIRAINQTTLECELIILGGTEEEIKVDFDQTRVKFLGFHSDLSSYYLNADLLCVPSHHEGFGQVYLEAASYGVIPICCDIPGPTDFIQHGVNGLIVEPKSPESILNLFERIQQEEFNLAQLSQNAFESALVYESSKVIDKNMDFFK